MFRFFLNDGRTELKKVEMSVIWGFWIYWIQETRRYVGHSWIMWMGICEWGCSITNWYWYFMDHECLVVDLGSYLPHQKLFWFVPHSLQKTTFLLLRRRARSGEKKKPPIQYSVDWAISRFFFNASQHNRPPISASIVHLSFTHTHTRKCYRGSNRKSKHIYRGRHSPRFTVKLKYFYHCLRYNIQRQSAFNIHYYTSRLPIH